MSFDEPEGYLDDIAETRETEALSRSGDDLSRPAGSAGSAFEEDRPLPTRSSLSADPAAGNTDTPWVRRGKLGLRFTRTMLVTALVLAGLAGIGNIAIHHLPRTTRHTYTYSNIQRLLVAVQGNGSVNVHGVDGNDITINATDKATLLDPVQRQIISSGGWLDVSVHCPSSECTSSYDIAVPRSTQVLVTLDGSTDAANINAQDLDSPVDLYTGHGDVSLTNLSASVHVVANGDVAATGLSGSSIDVFAPIAKSVTLQVTGTPQLVRLTTGQPGRVDLALPSGAYNISCQPKPNCTWPGSVAGVGGTGPITDDPDSAQLVQVTVDSATTANIHT